MNMAEFTQRDRDLLLTLNLKVDRLSVDVAELKDGSKAQLTNHDFRIEKIENTISKFDPTELTPRFFNLEQEVHDFKTMARVYRVLAGAIGGAVFFVLTQIPAWIGLLEKRL